jgi:hypothetical protein
MHSQHVYPLLKLLVIEISSVSLPGSLKLRSCWLRIDCNEETASTNSTNACPIAGWVLVNAFAVEHTSAPFSQTTPLRLLAIIKRK